MGVQGVGKGQHVHCKRFFTITMGIKPPSRVSSSGGGGGRGRGTGVNLPPP